MTYQTIVKTIQDGVMRLRLHQPPLNVLTRRMVGELQQTLEETPSDSYRVLVLESEGKHFSAGADIQEHFPEEAPLMLKTFHRFILNLLSLECPTVARVRGHALGGGCELTLACDFILASEEARFGQPEIKVGCFPPVAAWLLPLRMAPRPAWEWILLGEIHSAQEAYQHGLLNAVFPADAFEAQCETFIQKLLQASQPVLRLAKKAIRMGGGWEQSTVDGQWLARGCPTHESGSPISRNQEESLPHPACPLEEIERLYIRNLLPLHDTREGLQAFLEKRPPRWKHQ